MAIKSLEPTEIEWQRVDIDKPETWLLWTEELKDAGLSEVEVQRVIILVMQANSLDENKLRKAREAFLHGLEVEKEKSSGPQEELLNTQNGEPANDGE